jgi:PAS domain-containing protein
MDALHDLVRAQLRSVFGGRSVIIAGGMAVAAVKPVEHLRRLGATRFLVIASGAGTGLVPQGHDVEVVVRNVAPTDDLVASFRDDERELVQPSAQVLDAVARFDPHGDAIALVPPFLDVRSFGDRPAFGARRSEWVEIEDKTIADEWFDAIGVPRPRSQVVPADAQSLACAADALDRGAGTVWAGDSRAGFNGAGECVRWVVDEDDRHTAFEFLRARCDRVRVATFVDGVPCSIHGFVVDDGVAVFRPVELVTLRSAESPRLRFCGCATFFDPPADVVETMRRAATRAGERLRATVGYRGAFTLDGIAAADGWVATECNPRFGAGLGYVEAALPELGLMLLHHAVVEGVADVPSAALESVVVAAGTRVRWGTAGTAVAARFDETATISLVGDAGGFRRAEGDEPADAKLSYGPGRSGGHVRLELDADRTPTGPPVAPIAVAGFAFAESELAVGLAPLTPAPQV